MHARFNQSAVAETGRGIRGTFYPSTDSLGERSIGPAVGKIVAVLVAMAVVRTIVGHGGSTRRGIAPEPSPGDDRRAPSRAARRRGVAGGGTGQGLSHLRMGMAEGEGAGARMRGVHARSRGRSPCPSPPISAPRPSD